VCGIAGAITKAALSDQTVRDIHSSMKHRGPDGASCFRAELNSGLHLTLLFTRLAIIDTRELAMQPIESNLSALVLNGEIYNFRELIKELTNQSNFHSNGDVEVASRYLDEFGLDATRKFDGMFAFARFNKPSQVLSLSRDFFGEKPLFYSQRPNGLFFASEIPTLGRLLEGKLNINSNKIWDYLASGYKNLHWDETTFFEEVRSVPAGTIIDFDSYGKKILERRYEEISTKVDTFSGSYENAVLETRNQLIRSVESRLVSDVPIALSLSGGVDSSILAAICKRILGLHVPSFFLQSKDSRYDETKNVLEVTNYLNLDTQFVSPNLDSHQTLLDLSLTRSQPIMTTTYLVHAQLLRLMSQKGIRVSLMGTAADEIFSGYYDHHLAYFYDLIQEGSEKLQTAISSWEVRVLPDVMNPELRRFDYYLKNRNSRIHNYYDKSLLQEYLNISDQVPRAYEPLSYVFKFLRNRMFNEIFHETTPVILLEDDANSMHFSIENRSPYLRKDLFNFVTRLPSDFLIRNGRAKAILRDAFSDLLPHKVLYESKKTGFNASVWELFPSLLEKNYVRKFTSSDSLIWDFVKKESFENLLSRSHGDVRLEKLVFAIVSTKAFVDNYCMESRLN